MELIYLNKDYLPKNDKFHYYLYIILIPIYHQQLTMLLIAFQINLLNLSLIEFFCIILQAFFQSYLHPTQIFHNLQHDSTTCFQNFILIIITIIIIFTLQIIIIYLHYPMLFQIFNNHLLIMLVYHKFILISLEEFFLQSLILYHLIF